MLKFHLFPRDLEKMPSSGISKTALGPRLLRSLRPSGSFGYALGRHLFQNPSEKGGISAHNFISQWNSFWELKSNPHPLLVQCVRVVIQIWRHLGSDIIVIAILQSKLFQLSEVARLLRVIQIHSTFISSNIFTIRHFTRLHVRSSLASINDLNGFKYQNWQVSKVHH